MRGLRKAGVNVGIGVGVLASFLGTAQAQEPPRSPARIARVRSVSPDAQEARGQVPASPMVPPGGSPLNPMNPMGAAPPPVLGAPRPLPGPTVNVEPTTAPGYAMPPGTVTGTPPVYTYPTPGQPYPLPGQAYPVPGHPYPIQGQPYAVQGNPYPPGGGYPTTYPGTLMPTPAPLVVSPALMPSAAAPPLMSAPPPDLDRPLFGSVRGPGALLAGPWGGLRGAPGRWTASSELLLWWVRPMSVPALVTTSSPAFNGVPGLGDTSVIYGNGSVPTSLHTGARFGGTYWFDDCHTWGLDASLFFLGRNGKEFAVSTDTYPLLARPFVNANQGIAFSELVAAPGLATGSVAVRSDTQLWGADVNLRRSLLCGPCTKIDLLLGYRYLRLTDEINITESFSRSPGSLAAFGVPTALLGTVSDQFRTINNFHGVNLGLAGETRRGRWTAEGRASVALGTVFQNIEIGGTQNIQFANGTGRATGGLLALPGANIGTFGQNNFGVLPEAGLKLSYDLTSHWKVGVGYNFLYLNSVVRAGQQIDPNLDVNRIPNFPLPGNIPTLSATRPTVPYRTTDMFAQGVSFSLQYTW